MISAFKYNVALLFQKKCFHFSNIIVFDVRINADINMSLLSKRTRYRESGSLHNSEELTALLSSDEHGETYVSPNLDTKEESRCLSV